MFFKRKTKTQDDTKTELAAAFYQVLDRTQATIQFDKDGTIRTANQNFLATLGYELEEVQGKHHSMFVEEKYARSTEYKEFWEKLGSGEFFTDQYPRVAKDGSTVWIQATYAPVLNEDGTVKSVIKMATDVTARREGISDVSVALEALSEGDLTHRITPSDVPDLALIGGAFNVAQDQLDASFQAVKTVAGVVKTNAGMVEESSKSLSERTASQAATLEQAAAAIEELTASARNSEKSVRDVDDLVSETKKLAENGGKVVHDAEEAMTRIESSSQSITQIISVIEGIAFQTNLLALNAGVEAARAGAAGSGFAVVASEVRSLAKRASESVQEISTLISESSELVSDGVQNVERVGRELKGIISHVSSISAHMSSIATNASEQSIALGEINTGIMGLDSVTQENAAMVHEMSTLGTTLSGDVQDMEHHIAAFQTNELAQQSEDLSTSHAA